MLKSRREKWSAFCTLWVVCSYPFFGAAYDITKTGGWIWDTLTWIIAALLWLLIFRLLAHKAGWWRMRRMRLGQTPANATYYVRQTTDWLVYALYCSDPRWRWATRNMIATVFSIPREAVATVTDFGGPSLLLYSSSEVVEHILSNIALACNNGVRDVVLIQHTATCKALVARGIVFVNEHEELEASEEVVRRAMALVRERVPHVKVWGAVMIKNEAGKLISFTDRFFGKGVKFMWVDGRSPSAL